MPAVGTPPTIMSGYRDIRLVKPTGATGEHRNLWVVSTDAWTIALRRPAWNESYAAISPMPTPFTAADVRSETSSFS